MQRIHGGQRTRGGQRKRYRDTLNTYIKRPHQNHKQVEPGRLLSIVALHDPPACFESNRLLNEAEKKTERTHFHSKPTTPSADHDSVPWVTRRHTVDPWRSEGLQMMWLLHLAHIPVSTVSVLVMDGAMLVHLENADTTKARGRDETTRC